MYIYTSTYDLSLSLYIYIYIYIYHLYTHTYSRRCACRCTHAHMQQCTMNARHVDSWYVVSPIASHLIPFGGGRQENIAAPLAAGAGAACLDPRGHEGVSN